MTAQAIAETFTAAAVVLGAGLLTTFAMRRITSDGDTAMTDTPPTDPTEPIDPIEPIVISEAEPLPPPAPEPVPAMAGAVGTDAVASLARRLNVMIGLLALLLVGALVTIALLSSRVAEAEDDAATARTELDITRADLVTTRDDLNRVEAGAELYASQITGFQEQLVALEPQVSAGVDEAITGLRSFG